MNIAKQISRLYPSEDNVNKCELLSVMKLGVVQIRSGLFPSDSPEQVRFFPDVMSRDKRSSAVVTDIKLMLTDVAKYSDAVVCGYGITAGSGVIAYKKHANSKTMKAFSFKYNGFPVYNALNDVVLVERIKLSQFLNIMTKGHDVFTTALSFDPSLNYVDESVASEWPVIFEGSMIVYSSYTDDSGKRRLGEFVSQDKKVISETARVTYVFKRLKSGRLRLEIDGLLIPAMHAINTFRFFMSKKQNVLPKIYVKDAPRVHPLSMHHIVSLENPPEELYQELIAVAVAKRLTNPNGG